MSFFSDLIDFKGKCGENYKNISIIADFNPEPTEGTIDSFIQEQELCNLIKQKTCFKSKSGTCIELISIKSSFKARRLFETGLSDPHHLIHILKLPYTRLNSLKMCNGDSSLRVSEAFSQKFQPNEHNNSNSYQNLEDILISELN